MQRIHVHNNPDIQQLINDIDDSFRQDDKVTFKELNNLLHKFADDHNDIIASIVARYYDTDSSFTAQDFNTCRQMLMDLLIDCEKTELDYYALKIYNTLAIIESEQAFYYESFEFYLKAFDIANKHPEFNYTAILSNNIGNLLVWLKEYDAALPYLKQAYYKSLIEIIDIKGLFMVIFINIIECYSYLRDDDKVKEWYDLSLHYANEDNAINVIESLMLTNEILKSYDIQNFEMIRLHVKALIENAINCPDYIYQFRSLLRALECCIKINDRVLCDDLISIIEFIDKDNQIDTFVFDYADLKIQYYYQFLKGKASVEICEAYMEAYYEQSRNAFKQMKKTYNHSLVVHTELAKAELDKHNIMIQNSLLEREIEMDTFTRLYNKISICDRIKKTLASLKDHNEYALMFIDIDYFKKVNDTYGHDIGDQVLLEVVGILKEEINDRVLVGRFGGDEFLLFLYPFASHTEPFKIGERLVKKGRTVKIPGTVDEFISLSIGIAQSTGISSFETLLQSADQALYKCKELGRNNYYIE